MPVTPNPAERGMRGLIRRFLDTSCLGMTRKGRLKELSSRALARDLLMRFLGVLRFAQDTSENIR